MLNINVVFGFLDHERDTVAEDNLPRDPDPLVTQVGQFVCQGKHNTAMAVGPDIAPPRVDTQ